MNRGPIAALPQCRVLQSPPTKNMYKNKAPYPDHSIHNLPKTAKTTKFPYFVLKSVASVHIHKYISIHISISFIKSDTLCKNKSVHHQFGTRLIRCGAASPRAFLFGFSWLLQPRAGVNAQLRAMSFCWHAQSWLGGLGIPWLWVADQWWFSWWFSWVFVHVFFIFFSWWFIFS